MMNDLWTTPAYSLKGQVGDYRAYKNSIQREFQLK